MVLKQSTALKYEKTEYVSRNRAPHVVGVESTHACFIEYGVSLNFERIFRTNWLTMEHEEWREYLNIFHTRAVAVATWISIECLFIFQFMLK